MSEMIEEDIEECVWGRQQRKDRRGLDRSRVMSDSAN